MTDHLSLQARLTTTLKDPHFYWWCGHVCLVCNSALYFSSTLSLNANPIYHTRAYIGVLISYAVVISKSIGDSSWFSKEFFRDENVQYFALAFYWYSYQPMAVTLVPYFAFSIFHVFIYLRTILLPVFFPKNDNPTVKHARDVIKQYTDEYHEKALQVAAYAEVVGILGRLIAGVLMFQTSILALVVFIHFLRLRFYLSPYTRDAMYAVTSKLDELLLPPTSEPYIPASISRLYKNIRSIVIRYGATAQSAPPAVIE
ncbi:hypothetical protein CLU79DRAFT_74006 [Phycomyces nitens]|nr:hypothetical protein CLU79DRAFT_74006 [Phycomyces nitens]